jgi:hypothetical protein
MYDVLRFADSAVRQALDAAMDLAVARGLRAPLVELRDDEVVAAFESERRLRAPGLEGVSGFAELSRFVQTADGWIRTHANYPHHRAALLRVLGEDDPLAAARAWNAIELEDAIFAAGGCAAAVRTAQEWEASAVVRGTVPFATRGDRPLPAAGDLPASGIRVLDLTRVIAGPVGTRYLGALGADVLRVDPPAIPELPLHVADGVVGKRLVERDLRADPLRDDELDAFDVLVHGYRPGALDAFGLSSDALAQRHPHLTVVQLSAWGADRARRGFDSLVQAAAGIADALREPDGTPGALPVQALDHATGYRIAAAALRGLSRRARGEGADHAQLALAQTAEDLMAQKGQSPSRHWPHVEGPALEQLPDGRQVVPPPGSLDGRPLTFT